ncbi:hypothetical protein [Streptomyces sp. B3I8]|nr:hypothetical protein [Streptomyces sp. B3I8]MDQ0787284.1 hypothetical protein [Streptomyces sp. B3I8]
MNGVARLRLGKRAGVQMVQHGPLSGDLLGRGGGKLLWFERGAR